jgi:hypothetical protein
MKLLTNEVNYDSTIELAKNLKEDYNIPVIFHCYWHGVLSEKQLISIKSCYYFNIHTNNYKNHKIILWV